MPSLHSDIASACKRDGRRFDSTSENELIVSKDGVEFGYSIHRISKTEDREKNTYNKKICLQHSFLLKKCFKNMYTFKE